jgi:hypothetical protein
MPQADIDKPRPRKYKPGTGNNRYARFMEDWLGMQRTEVLDAIAKALDNHQQVLVLGANGVGKSYGAAGLGPTALYTNPNTVVPITAGTGGTLEDNIWKPIKSLWKNSELPGRYLDNKRELRTEFDDEWYLKCVSPKYPDDLEGDHNDNLIYIIEEADKPGVTYEHIDSVRSTVTDETDRIVVIANPPEDESNSVYELMQSDEWHTLQFASWDSHNVKVETGDIDGEKIGGLATLGKIKDDWKEYHDEPWPGLETVKAWSNPESAEFRTDLHTKWYKRRAGIMPPEGAEKWRPFSVADVEAAYQRDVGNVRVTPEALGVDVADKVDTTKAVGLHGPKAVIEYDSQADLPTQQRELIEKIREWPDMDGRTDAIGRGAQIAQALTNRFPDFEEFGSNEVPVDDDYRTKWAHGLQLIGEWLRGNGSFEDGTLYEQLKVAARVVSFKRNSLKSRGKVIEATPKERLKDELGTSPDTFDALLMAIVARETTNPENNVPLAW